MCRGASYEYEIAHNLSHRQTGKALSVAMKEIELHMRGGFCGGLKDECQPTGRFDYGYANHRLH